jgi:uncharacterized protein with beta-barrel porin domain
MRARFVRGGQLARARIGQPHHSASSWGLSQGLGSGRTDAFHAGLYGSQQFGHWYLSGAAAFANYWASTNRMVTLPAVDT